MKNLTHPIRLEVVDKLLSWNDDSFQLLAEFDGSLLDNYLFTNCDFEEGKGITIGRRHKPRKYIVVREKYLNSWSSESVALETNSERYAKEFLEEAEKNGEIYY